MYLNKNNCQIIKKSPVMFTSQIHVLLQNRKMADEQCDFDTLAAMLETDEENTVTEKRRKMSK